MKTAIIFAFLVGLCLAADPVEILSEEKELHPDGQYKYNYKAADGSSQQQSAEVKIVDGVPVLSISGEYTYLDAEGESHNVKYTADETGYHAESSDLPVAPEIPDIILQSLKYIQEHPQKEDK